MAKAGTPARPSRLSRPSGLVVIVYAFGAYDMATQLRAAGGKPRSLGSRGRDSDRGAVLHAGGAAEAGVDGRITALASALLVSLLAYGMPAQLALISTLYGAAYGMFPIAWIVFSSIMLYRLAVDTGKFEIIKDSVGGLTNDRRLQAMFIAFSFGAFIEGAAGFGAPVAVSGAMLAGLGFSPFYAAGICLLANTAPVAFGSIGIPVTTLANVTGLPVLALSAMVGRLCAMISVIIPGYLIVVMAGCEARARSAAGDRRLRRLVCRRCSSTSRTTSGPELTDILSSLTCIVVMVLVLKLWTPKNIMRLEGDKPVTLRREAAFGGRDVLRPGCPTCCSSCSSSSGASRRSRRRSTGGPTVVFPAFLPHSPTLLNGILVPGLHNMITRIPPVTPQPAPYAAALRTELAQRVGHCMFPGDDRDRNRLAREATQIREDLRRHVQAAVAAMLTIASMLGLAYLMNYSGHDVDAGARAGSNAAWCFRSSAPWSDGSASS